MALAEYTPQTHKFNRFNKNELFSKDAKTYTTFYHFCTSRVFPRNQMAPSASAKDELSAFFVRPRRQRPLAIQRFAFVRGCLSLTRDICFYQKA